MIKSSPRSRACARFLATAVLLAVAACGGGSGEPGTDAPDAAIDPPDAPDGVTLADRAGCHMLPMKVPDDGEACMKIEGICLVGNEAGTVCGGISDIVRWEWQAGTFYNVKAFGWTILSSSHGDVTDQTNADWGILGVPVDTDVTSVMSWDLDTSTWDVKFRMEDDGVVFLSVVKRP